MCNAVRIVAGRPSDASGSTPTIRGANRGPAKLLDRIARNPGTDASRMLLASCYGHLGRADDARAVWTELLKVNPDFSLTQRSRVLPYKNADDFQRIVEGLVKAGLP